MAKQIAEYDRPEDLRNIMANAKRHGRNDVWQQAFRRLCELEGINQSDPLHREFYATLAAYEELLSEKNGRRTSASRTRQKLKNKGVIQCLEDWALSTTPTEGFELLVKCGLSELTGESLVLKYPQYFSDQAAKSARLRLEKLGAALPSSVK